MWHYIIPKDEYDFVAIGRALISNPDWPKFLKNEEFEKIKIFTPIGFRGAYIDG